MLRNFFVTATLQARGNVKVAQMLAGHHSAAFTLDVYADALPQQMNEAGENVADVISGVTGAPGHNAAREIIADFRRGRLQRAWLSLQVGADTRFVLRVSALAR